MRANTLQRSRDEHELYFRQHPAESDREYLLWVFGELAKLPGGAEIFGQGNLLWELPNWLSGDAAGDILRFFQTIDPNTGALVHDFTDPEWDTRFLGDLYQDLSEAARKKYALLQTPIFVEEFILDRTLEPALNEFQAEWQAGQFRMIDPACGSGHFLLGSFDRLLGRWLKKEPGTNARVLAQRALDAVHGVDVNPFAVAIARFRLLLAAMKASDVTALRNAPNFKLNLACGDSLLHGEGSQLVLGDWAPMAHHFKSEDIEALNRILQAGRYHAVVANPPYILPQDKALNQAYRQRYETCHRKYSLAVPFMERIFQLAAPKGFVGQITANSFMKREFGKKLIEVFFPQVDLTHVIDTSGAYIPGHGTPTVILFGRNREPIEKTIRTVMGIRGEPSTPDDPKQGLVWSAILKQVDVKGSESEFVSVADSQRELFHKHPWSIGGGGAAELKEQIDAICDSQLKDLVTEIGFFAITGEDEAFSLPTEVFARYGVILSAVREFVIGEIVRDWGIEHKDSCLFPYTNSGKPVEVPSAKKYLWAVKCLLNSTLYFGKTKEERSMNWWEYVILLSSKIFPPLSIAFAFVATHNHFVLDRGGKVFKQSAPVIKLPASATEDDHLALLGLLNSSTACFWMKQTFHDKGGGGIGGGLATEGWEHFFEYEGTKAKQFPFPSIYPVEFARKLDYLASQITALTPEEALKEFQQVSNSELDEILIRSRDKQSFAFSRIVSYQEELDWECYRLYALVDEDLTYQKEPISIQLGQRAFEIIMARKIAAGELETTWFERHRSTPITELPNHWPDDYKQLVERRIELIETDKNIGLIEQPEYKRRWNTEPWESQLERALQNWLLNRLESYFDLDGRMRPHPQSLSLGRGEQEVSGGQAARGEQEVSGGQAARGEQEARGEQAASRRQAASRGQAANGKQDSSSPLLPGEKGAGGMRATPN
ncbi:BREX-2 system adenine-specific DNA-methyltransferase PglX [Egbenema bharatensis]|uniref:BREX-2 system adenine-specific DNA-methyltransferase PglX n=1 Tax=Egbenema bharatensis TaxID=3463334 RepID=UPI003A8A67FD